MRPRLCRVGGATADAVLLNWMLPVQAADARQWVEEGRMRRDALLPWSRHRFAWRSGPAAWQRLRDEEDRYRNKTRASTYFEAMNVALGSVGVAAWMRPGRHGLAPYQSVLGLPIVRVLALHDATSLGTVATAAALERGAGYAV